MANTGSIAAMKAEIDANIVPNNNAQLITGAKVNTTMKDMVDTLNSLSLETANQLEAKKVDFAVGNNLLHTTPKASTILSNIKDDFILFYIDNSTWNNLSISDCLKTFFQHLVKTHFCHAFMNLLDYIVWG